MGIMTGQIKRGCVSDEESRMASAERRASPEGTDAHLRRILDSVGEGIGLLGPDFTILELNEEAMRIDGRRREEVVGQSHWLAYPGTEDSELGRLYQHAMANRVPFTLKHRYHWSDGRTSWFETRAYPATDGGLAVFYRDVTEAHTPQERLRQSELRFRAAVAAIDGVLWTNDAQGEMIGEQAAWAALTGQAYDEYQGYGWASAVHPDDAQPTIDAWRSAVAAKRPFVFEHRVRRHDGEWRRFAIRAIPVLDEDGDISEWVGVHRDITERQQRQALLERNAETFFHLVKSNPFGLYIVDADFRLAEISQGAEAVFATIPQPVGRDFDAVLRTLWPEPFASEVLSIFRHTLETGEPYVSLSTVERRADIGEVQSYDWRTERIVLPDGRPGVVCFFYDLSERNRFEETLKQSISDKELLAREIDHRVKNSLAIVSSLLSMQRGASTSQEIQRALTEASNRVMAIARVHERLHRSHQLGMIAFDEYLQDLCRDLTRSLRKDGIKLDLRATHVELPAEFALALALIANELVTNAFKHGASAGASIISVVFTSGDDGLTLEVADDGAGLPLNHQRDGGNLGFKLVEMLSRQLSARLEIPHAGEAARFRLVVPASTIRRFGAAA